MYAASISTFVGYMVTMGYRIVDVKKYINIKYNIKQYLLISIILVLGTIVYYMENMLLSIITLPVFVIIAILMNKEIVKYTIAFVSDKFLSKKDNT